jgi:guanine deaminase
MKMIIKGNFVFSLSANKIATHPNCYMVLVNGIIHSIHSKPPEDTDEHLVMDYSNHLIIPGFTDLHTHASQFCQRGLGMDLELLPWLEQHTFHEETLFSNRKHAETVYGEFVESLIRQGTLHACIWATIHKDATELLFDILSQKGIKAFVGKVNMDQTCPESLQEDTETSLKETEELIIKYKDQPHVKPILTPRFVPACSKTLLKQLGEMAVQYQVPVQSHLAENQNEVKLVKKLHPEAETYADVYAENGLLGQTPTLMAHCIHLNESEKVQLKEKNIIAVHCPDANLNLASGIMPVKILLKEGIRIGLGTDVGAGHNLSMAQAMVRAIQLSKILKSIDGDHEALTFEEAFYMATKGNGSFFGKVGSFEEGYSFDALVIDDHLLGTSNRNLLERLQRYIYIGDDRNVIARFINGNLIH